MPGLEGFLLFLAALAFYLLPSIVANRRYHRNANAILITNLFLGWTGAGWVIALIWASTNNVDSAGRLACGRHNP